MYKFNAEKIKNEIVKWISNWFEINGNGCNAVVGISGGKDSTIVAALCVEALGKDRVIGVLMPHGTQADIDVSYEVCKYLGIDNYTINIFDSFLSIKTQVKEQLSGTFSAQSSINLAPRLRMATLYAVSQSVNGRVANTCNLSEEWVGYSTRYGDQVGDFSPLANLTVAEVKQIGYALGLPKEFIEKVPADGLCDKTDEDNLGFTYEELDRYIRKGVIENIEHQERIEELHNKNLFKLKPMPSFRYKGVK